MEQTEEIVQSVSTRLYPSLSAMGPVVTVGHKCHVPASHSGRHEQRLLVGVLGDGARPVDEGDASGLLEHRRGQGGISRRTTGGGGGGGGHRRRA